MNQPRCICNVGAELGEGPVWIERVSEVIADQAKRILRAAPTIPRIVREEWADAVKEI